MKRLILSVLIGCMLVLFGNMVLYGSPSVDKTFNVAYDEPTTNADTTPLMDLQRVDVYYTVAGGLPVLGASVPATSPNGGGIGVSTQVVIPAAELPADVETLVAFYAIAVDTSGNQSAKSNEPQDTVDFLDPSNAANLTSQQQ